MAEKEKRDILIHFDESSDEIIFYTVAATDTEIIRKSEFDGAKSDIASFQSKNPDEAEKDMGGMIFSLLDTFSKKQIKIRDYAHLNDIVHKEYLDELEIEAMSGSPEAKYHLFIQYHSLALSDSNVIALERAEILLNESASLGYKDAIDRLNKDWSLMKEAAIRKIERNKKS